MNKTDVYGVSEDKNTFFNARYEQDVIVVRNKAKYSNEIIIY